MQTNKVVKFGIFCTIGVIGLVAGMIANHDLNPCMIAVALPLAIAAFYAFSLVYSRIQRDQNHQAQARSAHTVDQSPQESTPYSCTLFVPGPLDH